MAITRPKFANEHEEAEWWDAHPEYIEQLLQGAETSGTLTHGTAAKRLGLKSKMPLPILLSKEDMDLASAQAHTRGIEVRMYVQSLLHEALVNAQGQ